MNMNLLKYLTALLLFMAISCAPKGTAVKYTFEIKSPQSLTETEASEFKEQVRNRLKRGGFSEATVQIENNQLLVEALVDLEKESDEIPKILSYKKIEFWETFRLSDPNIKLSQEFLKSVPGFVPYTLVPSLIGREEIIGLYTNQADIKSIKEKIENELNYSDVKVLCQKYVSSEREHVINKNAIYLINTRGSTLAPISNKSISKAEARKSEYYPNKPEVLIKFNKEGAQKWAEITENAAEDRRKIAIAIDSEVFYAPIVTQAITGGKAVISGGFSMEEAEILAKAIGLGEMNYNLKLLK